MRTFEADEGVVCHGCNETAILLQDGEDDCAIKVMKT